MQNLLKFTGSIKRYSYMVPPRVGDSPLKISVCPPLFTLKNIFAVYDVLYARHADVPRWGNY